MDCPFGAIKQHATPCYSYFLILRSYNTLHWSICPLIVWLKALLKILQTTHHQINTDVLGIVAILVSALGGLIAAIVWNFLRQLDCFSDKYRELRQEKPLKQVGWLLGKKKKEVSGLKRKFLAKLNEETGIQKKMLEIMKSIERAQREG